MKRFCKRGLCLLLTLALCAGLLAAFSVSASAETLEERQQAVVATALAYFDRGQGIQYDGTTIVDGVGRGSGGKTRSTNQEPPEYGTPHETLYSVCSDFAHQVYWEAFHYQLMGSAGNCWTGGLCDVKETDPMYVYRYTKDSGKDVQEAIHEMFALAQPGDVFSTYSTAGHTMVYVGDVYGDGVKYLAHCFGSGFKMDTGKDSREYPDKNGPDVDKRYGANSYKDANGGAIRLTPNAEEHFIKSYGKGNQVKMSVVRPLNKMTDAEYPILPATKYRMTHPRLSIERIVEEKTRFTSAVKGETLTLSITLSNSSKQDYTVPVTEKIPAGVTVKKAFEGSKTAGDAMTWNVELKAGDKKTFTCTYEVTADRGATISFGGSSVGDIPSNTIPVTVAGAKLNDAEKAKLADLAAGNFDALKGTKDAELGNAVYQKILGLNVQFPTAKEIWANGTETHTFKNDSKIPVIKDKDPGSPMMVPTFHGGRAVWNEWGHERMNDPRDMHVEPGDVIVRVSTPQGIAKTNTLVYLGGGKYLGRDDSGKIELKEEPDFVKSLTFDLFYCLRPSLAYDDLHTLPAVAAPAESKFKFTDVKESDWFYTYVKDLVEDGTVNGMTETTFVPNGTLTFGQALKLITLAVGEKEQEKTGPHWASGYLSLAKSKAWLGEDLSLDGTVTRLQFCRIAAKAKGLTEHPEKNPFTDTFDADVLALYKAGVINGMTATEFKPDGLLTRAQIAKIIWTLRKV